MSTWTRRTFLVGCLAALHLSGNKQGQGPCSGRLPTMMVGDRVRINAPGNPLLHGTEATVTQLAEWGAHLSAPASATGQFRAAWSEMEVMESYTTNKSVEYSGDCCQFCGSTRLRWAGACKVCDECGESNGCS